MTRYSSTMSEILSQIREGFSPKQIKMAIGIASDKRYKGGNYSGAVRQIEKIKKGLSDHPQVAAVLKRQNEQDEPASPDEGSMATDQLEFIKYAADEIMQHIQNGGEFPEWMQNKLSGTHEKMKGLHANINHENVQDQKEGVEPIQWPSQPLEEAKKITKKERDKLENDNEHGELALRLAQSFGTPQEVKKIQDINKRHMKQGSIDPKDQKERDAISNKYYKMAEQLEEGKSSTGYELYHKDFSSAMKHAYDFAKKKFGIEVDPKEIDDKVASGPRKPSKGKTNSYRLLGKDGKKAIQVQVYGMDNGKYELNMYKEESLKETALMIAEKLKVSDGLGAWIDDFKKSDAPQFDGKSEEQKKKMAIAAFVDAGGKLESVKEEEEPKEPEQSDGAKAVAQGREDKKKTRIAQLQLQIAKAQETINKLNAQEKPSE
jgi:hypothetical protein